MNPDYLDHLVSLDSDPEVMRFINGGAPNSRERISEKLREWTSHYDDVQPSGFWAAHLIRTDEFIGWVHLKPDRLAPELNDLGYRLKRSAWGTGMATELARAMIQQTLLVWNRQPVVAYCLVANAASSRVMEKCGMALDLEFLYPESVLPGVSEAGRKGARYKIDTIWDQNPDTSE